MDPWTTEMIRFQTYDLNANSTLNLVQWAQVSTLILTPPPPIHSVLPWQGRFLRVMVVLSLDNAFAFAPLLFADPQCLQFSR